jgi:hypothetical protein
VSSSSIPIGLKDLKAYSAVTKEFPKSAGANVGFLQIFFRSFQRLSETGY